MRKLLYLLIVVLCHEAMGAESEFYFPPPGEGLESQSRHSPEQAGLKPEIVKVLQGKADRWALWRNGHLIHVEGEWNQKRNVASLRKTWHAITVGAAIQQGKVPSYQQKLNIWEKDLQGNDSLATWWHVITQSSAFDYPYDGHPDYRPGEMWTYSDKNPGRLCNALAKVFGRRDYHDHYEAVLKEAYFDAIGMRGWEINFTKPDDGVRLILDLEDMGRLGLLALARGRWNGKQLIPQWYVEELERKQTAGMKVNYNGPDDGAIGLDPEKFREVPYGYMTWVNSDGDYYPGADRAWAWGSGAGGNVIYWNRNNGIVYAAQGLQRDHGGTLRGIPHLIEECLMAAPANGELRLSLGETLLDRSQSVAVDLAKDDGRYLSICVASDEDRAAAVRVEVPEAWKSKIEVYREDRGSQRYQLLPLSDPPVNLRRDEPLALWLEVRSRDLAAGHHRIPLVIVVGDHRRSLEIELQVWPVSLAAAERPFHVRGYWMLPSLTGGYEVNEESSRRLDAFLHSYAEMGGNVLDWTVNWPEVFPRLRIVGTGDELGTWARTAPSPIDLEHLPGLDFSCFDPWFEIARQHGVTRFEAHLPETASPRWQWALDAAVGKGRVKAGTPEGDRIAIWVYRELKRHLKPKGFHGFFCKVSDEIMPEYIPSYLTTAKVAREAGWRPFTTITGMIPRTAGDVRRMNPLCDQWQLGFGSQDAFFKLLEHRYVVSESTVPLNVKWSLYTNGGAERTWSANRVFGPQGATGIPAEEVERLEVLEDGKPLILSGDSPWGNRTPGKAFTAGTLHEVLYLSPRDGQEPRKHRNELKLVRRRESSDGQVLASIDPSDELWCYGGPVRPDKLPYGNTWALPAMALYRGLDGYAQWAFQWWKEDSRIVWLEPQTHRVTISPAYCGFRDGWRDAVLFRQLIVAAGRDEYEKIVGTQATAALRVGTVKDPTYPLDHGSIPVITSIANAGNLSALNAARRRALMVLAESAQSKE